jgi:hypothetical protein
VESGHAGHDQQQQPSNWRRLAEQASKEMDSEKLLSLVHELNRVLGEREEISRKQRHQTESGSD